MLLTSLFVKGQADTSGKAPQKPPAYFLDSVKLMTLPCFDPEKIASIDVLNENDPGSDTHGKIVIKTKNPSDFKFLTIADVKAIYKAGNAGPGIIMLDNELIKDISSFRIDSSYILSVQITRGSEISYLKDTNPGLYILKIITRTKENLDRKNQIWIRGRDVSAR